MTSLPQRTTETNVIYCDDNLKRLALLPSASVDLIYLDPPFFSNRHYEVIWGDEAEVRSFADRWEGGINHYVEWMRERTFEMWRVLKPSGSLYLHCDWHASHYLKVMLDDVCGAEHFQNEIVWHYRGGGVSPRRFGRRHDSIFFYTKGKNWVFNVDEVRTPYSDDSLARLKYKARSFRGSRVYDAYEPNPLGKHPDDVLMIQPIMPSSKERLGYPTQKPERLLEVFIKASSNPGDTVLDPFAGCGTSLVVAHAHQRQWIGIDISPTACNLIRRRLAKVGAPDPKVVGLPTTIDELRSLKPFEFQNWIVDRINGIQSNRKTGDMGIDGWTFLLHEPVQIKQSERVGRNVVDNFQTAIKRAKKDRGFVISFSFTRNAHEEAARARKDGLNIDLIDVADLLASPEGVMARMGVQAGLLGASTLPMPQFETKGLSAADLVEEERKPT